MRTLFLSFFLFFGFITCARASNCAVPADTTAAKTKTECDGSSFDTAIVIHEKRELSGGKAEYSWIRKKYPGYKVRRQSLNYYKNKPFDIIYITTAEGVDKNIYFDISNFFGKL